MTEERLQEIENRYGARYIYIPDTVMCELTAEVRRLSGLLEVRMWPCVLSLPNVELPRRFDIYGRVEDGKATVDGISDTATGRVVWRR